MHVFCSTGAFWSASVPDSYQEAILTYGPQLRVDGFEVMFDPTWYGEAVQRARSLRSSGLSFPVVHLEKRIGTVLGSSDPVEQEQGVQWLERNCAFAQQIGASLGVLHLWAPNADTHLERNLQPLPRCLDIAAHYGLKLAIETMPCLAADPLTNVKRAWEQDARTRVALDSEFLALHEQLEAVFRTSWLWKAGLVCHVHFKDYDRIPFPAGSRRYLQPGEGQIDFARFVRQLSAAGFSGALSLEAPAVDREGRVDVARLQASLDRMVQWAEQA